MPCASVCVCVCAFCQCLCAILEYGTHWFSSRLKPHGNPRPAKKMWCNPAVLMSLLQRNVDVCTVRMTKCVEHMSVMHMHLTSTAKHCESSEAPVTSHCNNAQRLASILRSVHVDG